jgi:hypothetical protein
MKVTINYDLDNFDIDDERKLGMALDAHNMYMVLWEFARNSKKGLEWSLDNKEIDKYEVIELVFERFFELLSEYHIDLNKYD